MDKVDVDLLEQISCSNPRLSKLYREHLKLDKEVSRLQDYLPYSSFAEMRRAALKKAKLRGLDEIMSILRQYRLERSNVGQYEGRQEGHYEGRRRRGRYEEVPDYSSMFSPTALGDLEEYRESYRDY